MKLTYHGHSCCVVEAAGIVLAIDPFFTGNPAAKAAAESVACDYILVTHGHDDHLGDAVALSKRCGATIIANFEISEYCAALGAKTHGMNPGGGRDFPFGRVKLTPARHSSSLGTNPLAPIYLGEACGVLLSAEGRTVYHAGDTALFLDMQLIGRAGIDLALLPIGDNYTMGPDDALTALEFLRPKLTVPIHYNTWPLIRQDAGEFSLRAARAGHKVRPLAPGESLDL